MPTMIDYLTWRGDLSFKSDPFNEIDALILACLSYVQLDEAVPAPGQGSIRLEDAYMKYFALHSEDKPSEEKIFIKYVPYIMELMAAAPRFKDLMLSDFVDKTDIDRGIQFAALRIDTGDGCSFISYRGTDDNIVGWKEDFYLSCRTVPAEAEAVEYLNEVELGNFNGIRLGGHSKGGHLSVYAVCCADARVASRVKKIYDFDGPGYNEEILNSEEFRNIEKDIMRVLPEFSIIGRLLENRIPPIVIESTSMALLQHDPDNWQIVGKHFVTKEKLSPMSDLFDETLTHWIDSLSSEEKEAYIEDLFAVLEASGEARITDIYSGGIKAFRNMLLRLNKQSPESSNITKQLLKIFFTNWTEMTGGKLGRSSSKRIKA